MAERIDNVTPLRGRAPIYPWDEWTDGSAWRIRRGVDFETSTQSMRSVLTTYAGRNNLNVRTSVPDASTVEFQFYAVEEAA